MLDILLGNIAIFKLLHQPAGNLLMARLLLFTKRRHHDILLKMESKNDLVCG